ncbi:MAG: aryl-sulfate sulfotransferase, partial [Halobacteriales archaeon]|nr:aryl-sulfate sulfotransferase [Halobacteriales archaeon]
MNASLVRRFIRVLPALLIVAVACESTTETDPWEGQEIDALQVVSGPIGLAPTLVATGTEGGCARVVYSTETEPALQVERCQEAGELALTLTRLLPERSYDVSVRLFGPDGEPGPFETTTFETPALPTALEDLTFDLRTAPIDELTLVHVQTVGFWGFVILDGEARVVWYWDDPEDGGAFPITKRSNGNYVIVAQRNPRRSDDAQSRLLEIAPSGELVHELVESEEFRDFHHEVLETSEGTILTATLDSEVLVDTVVWEGDRIVEWSPEEGWVRERWDMFDFYDPADPVDGRSRPSDYGHMNSFGIGPDGTVVVAVPFLQQVIGLSPDFSTIEWKLNGPGATLTTEGEPFSGVHTAGMPSPGHVLLFDNGVNRASGEQYSRAIEYELDFAGGTAPVAWSFRPSPDIFSRIVSSAYRVEDGNTLVHFGSPNLEDHETFLVSGTGEVLWHVVTRG